MRKEPVIGDSMLVVLVEAEFGGFALSSGGAVWVTPAQESEVTNG